MVRTLLAAALVMALAACGQNAPAAPEPGADVTPLNAPTQQSAAPPEGQARLSDAERAQLHDIVRQYLDSAQQQAGQGYTQSANIADEVTGLQPGSDHRWQLNLEGGATYRFVGGCDNECSDLDIELIDQRGAVVASDLGPSDFPVVSFTPASGGQFTVRLMMQACTIAPCFAGVRVLTAPRI
jgi:predicted small lipoprotein YifL